MKILGDQPIARIFKYSTYLHWACEDKMDARISLGSVYSSQPPRHATFSQLP